jgi:hypothetical protein
MVSFNEMHGYYYEFQASLSAYVCYCVSADHTLSLHFIVHGLGLLLWIFCYYENARSKGKKS